METIKGKITNIVQAEGRGTIQINEIDATGKQTGLVIAISYPDPAEARKYIFGGELTIEIKTSK